MTSVGSVEIDLSLNRTQFDKQLRELESIELEPLNLDIKLEGKNLRAQIRDLTKDLDCIPLDICAHVNVNALKADIAKATADLQADFQVNVRAAVESIVKVDVKKQGENAGTDKAKEKLEAGFEKVADTLAAKINNAIDQSLKTIVSTAAAPLQGVARGFFEGIGQTASRELSNGIIKNFQKTLDISFKSVGGQFGGFAAKEVGKALGLKPIPKPRGKQQDSDEEGTGGVRRKPPVPKPSAPSGESDIGDLMKSVARDLGTFASIVQKASGGSDKFGASAIKAAQEALQLAAGLSKAYAVLGNIQSQPKPTQEPVSQPPVLPDLESRGGKARTVVGEAILKPSRGFLKGDISKLRPEDARKQVESVRSRLEKQLAALQGAPETEATQKKIVSLVNAIATLESRIAADIANPEIPKAVRQSLGQLKGASSKLAETKRTAEAEVARVTANRKLPGIAKGVLGAGIGASALGAGGAFAAPSAGIGGLGFLSALPFDPTLGLAAGGVAASLFAAQKVPGLLRKAGANRAADVLETDVTKFVRDTVKAVFGQIQQGLSRVFRRNKAIPSPPPLLNSPPVGATDTPATIAFAQNMRRLALSPPAQAPQEKPQAEDTPALKAFARNMRSLAAKRGTLPTKPTTLPPLPPFPPPQVANSQNTGRLPTKPTTLPPLPPFPRPPVPGTKIDIDSPTPKPLPLSPPPPVPNNYWERFFRGLEARFYRSPLFSGNVSPKDRRSLTSEAAGFFVSGAALVAPAATLTAFSVPLLVALTPLITTVGLVTNALSPLVSTVSQTLQRIEPLTARLQYVSGSPQGVEENRNFVQSVAERFNVSSFSSLEQFSKLSAAVKGTRLEGEPLKELFKGIATAAKGLSLDTQDLSLVMYAFTQIASKGKLSAEEVRLQLAERFPGIVNILAKSLNVTTAEFNKMLETGSLIAEDVLPKLGKALQQEYGAAAVAASGNFLSALTKVENAIFKIQESVARSLAPLFGFVANTLGNVLGLIGQFADKIVPIFSVVLIGVAAQFFVGLTQILEGSGIIAKMTAFLVPLFSRLFVTLTPFAVGILADFLDDVFGAQASVMDNLMKGVFNIVLSSILVVNELRLAIVDVTASLPKNDSLSGVGNVLGGIFSFLQNITKLIPSTVIELTSLTLILAQTLVLAQGGLNLVLARFGITVAQLGASFIAAARSGKLFESVMNTLSAGLSRTQLGLTAATAAVILFFAKADFTNELGSEFDKLADQMTSSLQRIQKALDTTSKDLEKFPDKIQTLPSQGFDLTLGFNQIFGLDKAFRTDDLINKANEETRKFYKNLLDQRKISQQEFEKGISNPLRTVADKQFDDNKEKLQNLSQDALRVIDESGLLTGQFDNSKAGSAFSEVKVLDRQIKSLQLDRVLLLEGTESGTKAIKQQIAAVDLELQRLLKKRDSIKQPIEEVRGSVLTQAEILKKALETINSANIPEDKKQELINIIAPTLNIAEKTKSKLTELGLIDLSPLGQSFSNITQEVEKLNKSLEKTFSRQAIANNKGLLNIQELAFAGKINREQADELTSEQEIANLRNRRNELEQFITQSRQQLFDLLATPNPSPDAQQTIEKVRNELNAKDLDLSQTELTLATKLAESARLRTNRRIAQLDAANKSAENALEGAYRVTNLKIKAAQTKAPNTENAGQLFDSLNSETRVDEISDRIELTRKKIATLDRRNFETAQGYTDARIQLESELGNLITQKLDERLSLEQRSQERFLRDNRVRRELEEQSLDRSRQLLQSRQDLAKAMSELSIGRDESQVQLLDQALEVRRKLDETTNPQAQNQLRSALAQLGVGRNDSELNILQRKQAIETEVSAKKLDALLQEQKIASLLLDIDLKRQALSAQTAVNEAEIANQRAIISTLEAAKELDKAKQDKDAKAISSASKILEINQKILDSTAKQVENAKANLALQSELAVNAKDALNAQQQSALNQLETAQTLQGVQQNLARVELTTRNEEKPSSSPSTTNASEDRDISSEKTKRSISQFEASRLKVFAPADTNVRNYLQPDQSGSIGLNRATSAESELKRSLGLDPFESVENFQKRQLGLKKGESVESYLNRQRSSFFGASTAGSFEQMNMKYKPDANNLQELQQKYKPLAESFEELQQKYPATTNGYVQFTSSLREANIGIEQKLDTLNRTMAQAIASPRQLYVSAPNPVSSAAEIYSDIARGMAINAGIG